jgi:hypothetical protein
MTDDLIDDVKEAVEAWHFAVGTEEIRETSRPV